VPLDHIIGDANSTESEMAFDGRVIANVGVLAAIVEGGSFERAGEALGLSRSGVSRRAVSRLEARVGVRLLNRTTKAVALTDEGRRLYSEVAPLLTVRRRVIEGCLLEPLEPGSRFIMADCPLDRISGKLIKMLRDRKAEVPEAANTRLKALRGLFKWALVDPDLASRFPAGINPARDVPSFQTFSQGHHNVDARRGHQIRGRASARLHGAAGLGALVVHRPAQV
jgi:hypothetical protein